MSDDPHASGSRPPSPTGQTAPAGASSSDSGPDGAARRALHRHVLATVARALAVLPSVLKGALIIAYGRDRHTEDLDYNAEHALSLEATISAALSGMGGVVRDIQLTKDTATVRRYIVSYALGDAAMNRFKVETSFRERIDPATVVMRHEVRTYTITVLAAQKLRAMNPDDGRTVPRDLEDIRFIAERYEGQCDPAVRRAIADLVRDGGDALLSRYHSAYAFSAGYSEGGLIETVLSLLAYRERLGPA